MNYSFKLRTESLSRQKKAQTRWAHYGVIMLVFGVVGLVFFSDSSVSLSQNRSDNGNETAASPKQISTNTLNQLKSLATPAYIIPSPAKGKPNVFARSYIVIDSATKYPLAEKNADSPVPIASTTKIMTALVTLDTYPDLNTVVVVPHEAAAISGSEIHLLTGEKLTVKNLMYAMLLSSANDAAYTLAAGTGHKDAFIAAMNTKAKTLGLQQTHYEDPAGLNDDGHSSPRDLAILMDYALKQPLFKTVVGTANYTIWSADQRYRHDLKNSNRLIQTDDPLYYSSSIGGKTGFTYDAGHCLIAAADYTNGTRRIAVILHTNSDAKDASAQEARKLLVWAENH